ncbi:MAG: divalent-cation tolerance protein CutA [Verrucomicrobia bacterium]|nr:divalent-cation tolerance protein CutA [Verrucomicrobiota bacterium]
MTDADQPRFGLVTTTVKDMATARQLATAIVERRLAACVHLCPVDSVYRWNGKIESAGEISVQAKTTAAGAAAVMAYIADVHDYDVPEILFVPIMDGAPSYLRWLEAETNP